MLRRPAGHRRGVSAASPYRVGLRFHHAFVLRGVHQPSGDRSVGLLPHLWFPLVPAVRRIPPCGNGLTGHSEVLGTSTAPDRPGLLAGPDRPDLRIPCGRTRPRLAGNGDALLLLADLLPDRDRPRDPTSWVPLHRNELLSVPAALRHAGRPPSPFEEESAHSGTGRGRRALPDQFGVPLLDTPYPPRRRTEWQVRGRVRPSLRNESAPLGHCGGVVAVVLRPVRSGRS